MTFWGIWCKDKDDWLRERTPEGTAGVAVLAFACLLTARRRAAAHFGFPTYGWAKSAGWCEVRPLTGPTAAAMGSKGGQGRGEADDPEGADRTGQERGRETLGWQTVANSGIPDPATRRTRPVTTHTTTVTGKCPLGCDDEYTATFETARLIPVEVIDAAIKVYTQGPVFQEDLTKRLADCLQCRVTLTGLHGRFETTTVAGAA